MSLTLILGPMKSGKSLELIARIAPYEFADKKVLYIQPAANSRDEGIVSRSGLKVKSIKVKSLSEIDNDVQIIGIDEAFMFSPDDIVYIEKWIVTKEIIVSTLDLDYRRRMPEIVKRLLELRPDLIIYKKAVCDVCKSYDAIFTQIVHNGKAVTGGLPTVTPEDGTYLYQARCRACHVKP